MASITGKNVDLNSAEGLKEAGVLYSEWLGNGFENLKTLTTNAIKLDWGVKNPFKK